MKDRIRQIRKDTNLNMEQFADRLGVTTSTVSMIESGKRNPSAPTIRAICREFHVNEEWLLNGNGDMYVANRFNKLDALCDEYNLDDAGKLMIQKFIELPAEDRAVIIKYVQSIAAPFIEPSEEDPEAVYKKEHSESATRPASYVLNSTAAIGDDEKKVAE